MPDGTYAAEMRLVFLPAYSDGSSIKVAQMTSGTAAAQRLTNALGAPPDDMAWSREQSSEHNVEDQEIMLILPCPFNQVVATGLPEALTGADKPALSLLVE